MTPKKSYLIIGALALALMMQFSGCQQTDPYTRSKLQMVKADLVTASEPQEYYTLFSQQSKKFDQAFTSPISYFAPEQVVSGTIISATLAQKEAVAGFFNSLQKHQSYKNIVVLSSTNIDSSTAKVFTTFKSFKTPYGFLVTDQNLIQTMQDQKIAQADEKIFAKELATNMYAPFIKKTFPDAVYLPLLVHEKMTQDEAKNLAIWLHKNLGEQTLVIARTTTQTSSDSLVADFQMKFIENVLQNMTSEKLGQLPLKNSISIQVLFEYLHLAKSQKAQTLVFKSRDSRTAQSTANSAGKASSQEKAFTMMFQEGPLVINRNIFLVSFGDIMLGRLVRSLMDRKGIDYPFQKMDQSFLQYNDLLLANLEGPIAKKSISTSKTIAFRFLPDIASLLKKYFFDALSEANNHGLDMGPNGLSDSFDLLKEQGILVFGDPRQVNENSVATTTIQGQKIAFLGLNDVDYKINQAAAVAKIVELNAQGYKVIPFLHWGVEYVHRPTERQQELAHAFVDAGAIAVIGCHPHVVQTFEIYKNKPIFYSLGNGIFDQYFSSDTQEGLSIGMNIANDQIQIYFLPIQLPRSQMSLMNEEQRKKFLEKFVTWGDYSEEQKQQILKGYLSL